MNEFVSVFKDICKINEPMSSHTTFKTGGPARLFVEPNDTDELILCLKQLKKDGIDCFVLGGGSNLIVSDKGIDGAVISMNKIRGIERNGCAIIAKAGVKLSEAANFALKNSLSGLEFSHGIPGTVGGGVAMNAGAYDGEIKNVIASAGYIDRELELKTVSGEQMRFGYRKSIFQDLGFVVTEAVFELERGEASAIKDKMNDFMNRRREKQPLEYPSAGSVFKRPEGFYAGKLIEEAGLKGFCIGGACVSEKHCGFIVNKGNAASSDIISLIGHIKKTVFEKFGVMLQTEVKIVGKE